VTAVELRGVVGLQGPDLDAEYLGDVGRRDAIVRWLRGEPISLSELATLLNCRRRDAELIGLDPAPRDITPDIATYMAQKAAEKARPAA
jgi:hypothetical protein